MDLLKKIQYNQELNRANALLSQVLLNADEVDIATNHINAILAECSDQQICHQARNLLQNLELRLSTQNHAQLTMPFGSYFVGMSTEVAQLQEAFFQYSEQGWGILSKNDSLWQIWIKKDKSFIQSLWSDTLEELSPWLAEKYKEISQEKNSNSAKFQTKNKKKIEAKEKNPLFEQEFNFSIAPQSTANSPMLEHLIPQPEIGKDNVQISPESIQLIASVLAEQLKGKNAQQNTIELLNHLQNTQTSEVLQDPKYTITVQQEKSNIHTASKVAQAQAIPSSPLSDGLELDFEMDLEQGTSKLDYTQHSLIENYSLQTEQRKNEKIVETWNCTFDLNEVEGIAYHRVKLSQHIEHMNLISCDIDMRQIQHSPIYMVENMDHQNYFKYYTFVFAAENSRHAINLINKLATKNQEQLAHISQITWKDFKDKAFELSDCCQLYHTSTIVIKASSLYSHISEKLISKQQMIPINEASATTVTPLLLLQESHRFRVIHGQQRLALGSYTNKMYPCIVLSRNSGVTWQMIREQLKCLPTQQVGVYELLDALRYAAEGEE